MLPTVDMILNDLFHLCKCFVCLITVDGLVVVVHLEIAHRLVEECSILATAPLAHIVYYVGDGVVRDHTASCLDGLAVLEEEHVLDRGCKSVRGE